CSPGWRRRRRRPRTTPRYARASLTASTARGAPSVRLVPEVRARDALLQVLERTQVLDDVAAGVVEEDLAVLVGPAGDQPPEVRAVLEQIVDGLRDATSRNDGDLRSRRPLGLLRHVVSSQYELRHRFNVIRLGEDVEGLYAPEAIPRGHEGAGVTGQCG